MNFNLRQWPRPGQGPSATRHRSVSGGRQPPGMTATKRSRPSQLVVAHLASQFRRPRCPLGVLAGRIMSTRPSNVARNRYLVEFVGVNRGHRCLEIGVGPGVAIEAAAAAGASQLIGVDHSPLMLQQCAARNADLVATGQLVLVEADGERLPRELGEFDRIWCMNVWHFWTDQERTIVDLAGRLSGGGRLVIGHQPRHRGATSGDADAARRCLTDQLEAAGLVTTSEQLDLDPPAIVVAGTRPT